MATLNIVGFEAGDLTEAHATAGAPTVQGTTKRSGQYALRVNPASGVASWAAIATYAATSATALLTRTAQAYYTFYFNVGALPSSGNTRLACVETNSGSPVCRINISSTGVITIQGLTTSATVATVSTGIWYRADFRVTSNGTCGLAIDGGTEQTCTGNNVNQDRFSLGRFSTEASTIDFYYDDVFISDSGFPGAGQVNRLDPDGDGTYTGWTGGSGTTFAEVDDDVPGHDSDTTYIQCPDTADNTGRTFSLESSASGGVTGTILAVRAYAVVRTESVTGGSLVGMRIRNGSTDVNSTSGEWITTYATKGMIRDTDPNGGGAWTSGGLDTFEVGVYAGSIVQAQRCTKVAAMVWCAGGPPPVAFVPTFASTSTASLEIQSVPLLQPSVASGSSLVATLLSTPLLDVSATATSSLAVAVTTPGQVTFAPVIGSTSMMTLALTSPALLAGTVVGASSLSVALRTTPLLVPVMVAGSSLSLTLSSTPLLVPLVVAGSSLTLTLQSIPLLSPNVIASGLLGIALRSTPLVSLSVTASSAALIALQTPALLSATILSGSTLAGQVRSPALLAPVFVSATTLTGGVQSPAQLLVTILATSSVTAAVSAPTGAGTFVSIAATSALTTQLRSTPLLMLDVLAAGSVTAQLLSVPQLGMVVGGTSAVAATVQSAAQLNVAMTALSSLSATLFAHIPVLFVVSIDGLSMLMVTFDRIEVQRVTIRGSVSLPPLLLGSSTSAIVQAGSVRGMVHLHGRADGSRDLVTVARSPIVLIGEE